MKLKFCVILAVFLGPHFINAQTKEIEFATVTDFNDPYDLIVITQEDIGDMSLTLDSLVNIKNKKGKTIKASEVQEGQNVKITYDVRDGKRIVTGINLLTEEDNGKQKFTGLFEGYDGNVAFVDGRKVKLADKATIKGAKKGEGKINMEFTGFNDEVLKKGFYMSVKGTTQPDGVVLADEIIVKKNTETKNDNEVIRLVNQNFNANGLKRVQSPTGVFNASNGLYNGNITVGNVDYKLSDDIKLQGYVNEVGYKLIPEYTSDPAWQKENQKIDFRFYVIEDKVPNAFAWPNGMVLIHTGLLKIIENEAQLAFVLSHEISHVLYEHGSARYKKSEQIKDAVGIASSLLSKGGVTEKISALTGIFHKNKPAGTNSAATTAVAAVTDSKSYSYYVMMQKLYGLGGGTNAAKPNEGNQLLSIVLNTIATKITPDALSGLFAKAQENQADRVGLYYAQSAGYDIREVPKFWSKMMTKNNDPAFAVNIANGFKSLLQNPTIVLNLNGDTKTQLLNSSAEMIINNVFKSVYSSHPLTQNRLRNTNQLTNTIYQNNDYSKAKVGKDEYEVYVRELQ